MVRSSFLLGIGGSAVALTILLQPAVRQTADRWSVAPASVQRDSAAVAIPQSIVQVASVPQSGSRTMPEAAHPKGRLADEKGSLKPRRTMRDGCEGAISSLAGPEARRMVPGRCIA